MASSCVSSFDKLLECTPSESPDLDGTLFMAFEDDGTLGVQV